MRTGRSSISGSSSPPMRIRRSTGARARSASSPSPARSSTARPAPAAPAAKPSSAIDRKGPRREESQGAGRSGRQPGRLGAGVRADPPGAAGRQGQEDPGRGVDGQRRRLGRLLGRDPRRLCLRRAFDHHRIDRRVRRAAELRRHAGQARHRRRRHQDHAAVGRARPAQGSVRRGRRADPGGGRAGLPQVPDHRRRGAPQDRRRISTVSPRAGCGTAAPRASSGWSTGSAGWTRRSPRRRELAKLGEDERGLTYLEEEPSFADMLFEAVRRRGRDRGSTGRRAGDRWRRRPKACSPGRSPRCGRS